jgi:hypothetical protein
MKVVSLSAPRTVRLYYPWNILGTNFRQRLTRPLGHSAAGQIVSMKHSSDTIGNRTRDLPVCSAVLQPTASLRVLVSWYRSGIFCYPQPSTTFPRTVGSLYMVSSILLSVALFVYPVVLTLCVTARSNYALYFHNQLSATNIETS